MFDKHMLHCHVAKVLPLVYDDSLSYYEVLCKLTHKINEIIGLFDNEVLKQEVHEYVQSADFSAWLRDYIESDDFKSSLAVALREENSGFKKLAVLGDSNADGYGWYTSEGVPRSEKNDGWTVFLREMYPTLEIKNFANAGATFIEDNGNNLYVQFQTLLASGFVPDTIVIQAGANDFNRTTDILGFSGSLKNNINTNQQTSCGAFARLVRDINVSFPDCKVYYFKRPYATGQSEYFYNYGYDRLIETAEKLNVPIFDLTYDCASWFNGNGSSKYYLADTVHWNRDGYKAVSYFIAKWLSNPVSNGVVKGKHWCAYVDGTSLYKLKAGIKTMLQKLPLNINFDGTGLFGGNYYYGVRIYANASGVKVCEVIGSSLQNEKPRKCVGVLKADGSYTFSVENFVDKPSGSVLTDLDYSDLAADHIMNYPVGSYYFPTNALTVGTPSEVSNGVHGHANVFVSGRLTGSGYNKAVRIECQDGIVFSAYRNAGSAMSGWVRNNTTPVL